MNAIEELESVATPAWLKLLPYIAVVALVAGAAFGFYHHGYGVAKAEDKITADAIVLKHNAEVIAWQGKVSTAEHEADKRVADIDSKYQEAITNEKQSTDRTIADLRSGAISLRKRLAAISFTASGLPCPAGSASCGNGSTTVGLQTEDAAVLVRLSAEADDIVRQLNACQAVVRADRVVKVNSN